MVQLDDVLVVQRLQDLDLAQRRHRELLSRTYPVFVFEGLDLLQREHLALPRQSARFVHAPAQRLLPVGALADDAQVFEAVGELCEVLPPAVLRQVCACGDRKHED